MQTFLPFADFHACARVLDDRRLGKQRAEVIQILNALSGRSSGWRNHPVTRMWSGYEPALGEYGVAICEEWRARGFRDTCLEKIEERSGWRRGDPPAARPAFVGDERFHRDHRQRLLEKDPDHYGSRLRQLKTS